MNNASGGYLRSGCMKTTHGNINKKNKRELKKAPNIVQ